MQEHCANIHVIIADVCIFTEYMDEPTRVTGTSIDMYVMSDLLRNVNHNHP